MHMPQSSHFFRRLSEVVWLRRSEYPQDHSPACTADRVDIHTCMCALFIWASGPHKWVIACCWKSLLGMEVAPLNAKDTFTQTTKTLKLIQLAQCMFLIPLSWAVFNKILATHTHTESTFSHWAFIIHHCRGVHSLECSPSIIMSSLLDSWDKWETSSEDMNSEMHFCLSARADCSCNLYLRWGL